MRSMLPWTIILTGMILGSSQIASVQGAGDNLEALEEQAFKHAAALVDQCLVRIETVGGLEQLDNVLLNNGPTTGVVVSIDGFIISSSFNFAAKPSSILITLSDGRRFAAKQVANDRLRLLTLLKIEVDGLTPAKPTPRDQVQVGQWALALGRTLDNTTPNLSVGIVSAVNRVWGKAIQTDAKTSPVNYGGALADVEGRVMGIIAPMSPMGNGELAGVEWYDGGIGFAIPLEDVYESLERLKQETDLLPGILGITFAGGQALNAAAIVDRVRYNSPAQNGGLKTNDRIIEADGQPVTRVAQMKQVLGRKYGGDSIKLVVRRGDQSLALDIGLVGTLAPYEIPFLGILPRRNQSSSAAELSVRHVFDKGPAEQGGLVVGDRIMLLNGAEIKDARTLSDVVGRSRPGDSVKLTYIRNSIETTTTIKLGRLPETILAELPAELMKPVSVETGIATPDVQNASNPVRAEEQPPNAAPTDFTTGRFAARLDGYEHDYWAYVPEVYHPSQTYGLLVWIHPPGDTMEATILKQWKRHCDRRGLILVAPKADQLAGWQSGEVEFIKGLIEHFRTKYSIDGQRIVLHSHGAGASMTWAVAKKHRELARGVVVTGAAFVGPSVDNEPDFRQQFCFFCGDRDKILARVRSSVEVLRKLKFPVTFRTIVGLAAEYPSEIEIDEIGRWIDSLDRI